MFADKPRHRMVLNQVDELGDYNAFLADPRMTQCLSHYGADWALDHAKVVGQVAGSQYMKNLAHKVVLAALSPNSDNIVSAFASRPTSTSPFCTRTIIEVDAWTS